MQPMAMMFPDSFEPNFLRDARDYSKLSERAIRKKAQQMSWVHPIKLTPTYTAPGIWAKTLSGPDRKDRHLRIPSDLSDRSFLRPGDVVVPMMDVVRLDDCDVKGCVFGCDVRPPLPMICASGASSQLYLPFLERLQDLTMSRNASLLLLGDVPGFVRPPKECMYESTAADCDLDRASATGRLSKGQAIYDSMEARDRTNRTFVYAGLTDLFCAGDICSPRIPGTNTMGYADGSHLSTAGALYLAPFIECFMRSRGLIPA